MKRPDLETALHSSIVTIDAVSQRGKRWLREHVTAQGIQSGLETGCDCDVRMAIPIIYAAAGAGLHVKDRKTGLFAKARD